MSVTFRTQFWRSLVCVLFAVLATAEPADALRQFIVFFHGLNPEQLDPEQWEVTEEANSVLSQAASIHIKQASPGDTIHLLAGDQNVGTLEMSIERSRRRAEAVKKFLVAKGVSAEDIVVHACGFRRYLVKTPPGTIEPMNRFVALDYAEPEVTTDPCKQ